MANALRVGVVCDPPSRFLPDKDTTFVFMLELQRRGHQVFAIEHRDLFTRGNEVHALARRLEVRRPADAKDAHYSVRESTIRVFVGCRVSPLDSTQSRTRSSARAASSADRHRITKSSA